MAPVTFPETGREFPDASFPSWPLLLFLGGMLMILGLLLYAQTFSCPFLWDEYGIILDNAAKGAFGWENLPTLFTHRYFYIPGGPDFHTGMPYYRPLSILVHGLSFHVFGTAVWWYRLESLFLHAGNAVLVYVLFSIFLSDPSRGPRGRDIALAAAFLYFVHPRNVESICIIANQTGLLCAFFSLLSLCCWARLLATGRHLRVLYPASMVALLLAMLAKESGYVVPLLHGLLLCTLPRRMGRKTLGLLAGYFSLIFVPLYARHLWLDGPSILTASQNVFSEEGSLFVYFGSVLALLFHQLDQWLFPHTIQLFQYPFRLEDFTFREAVLPLVFCGTVVWFLRGDRRILAFGFGLFLIAYLPSSNLIPMGKLPGGGLKTGAHHLYLAQAGLVLLCVSVLFSSGGKVPAGGAKPGIRLISWSLTAVWVLLLCRQTFLFAGNYRSADRFYQGVLARNRVYSGAWQNYGYYKLTFEDAPGVAERILLEGLTVMRSEGDSRGRRKLVWNLLHLYQGTDRALEAATLLECVADAWVQDPVGNDYYWSLVRRFETERRRLPQKSHLRRSAASLVIQRTESTLHSSGFDSRRPWRSPCGRDSPLPGDVASNSAILRSCRLPCIRNFLNSLQEPLFQRVRREQGAGIGVRPRAAHRRGGRGRHADENMTEGMEDKT